MDYKVFRTAVLAIVSALILVLVIVYATNADKIKEIFGKGGASDTEASADTSSSSDFGMYGEQIGDNTQAFLFEEGFFDANEDIPSVVVTKKGENRSSAGILPNPLPRLLTELLMKVLTELLPMPRMKNLMII